MPESSPTTQSTFIWEKHNLDPSFHGVFQYHDYVAKTLFTSKIPLIGIGGFFRHLFVCIPSALFFSFFLFEKRSQIFWQEWVLQEKIATSVFGILVLVYLIGLGYSIRGLTQEA
jgi:hypothetical protein